MYKVSRERPVFWAPGTNGNVKQCEPEHFVWLSPDPTSSCRERDFPDISTNLRGLWASEADCIEIPTRLDKRTSIQGTTYSQCTFILRSLSADNNKCHSHFPYLMLAFLLALVCELALLLAKVWACKASDGALYAIQILTAYHTVISHILALILFLCQENDEVRCDLHIFLLLRMFVQNFS